MQYKSPIITQAYSWDNDEIIIPLDMQGDSLFIGLSPNIDQTLNLSDVLDEVPTVKLPVSLSLEYENVISVITEGDSFNIVVSVEEPAVEDIVVDFEITYDTDMVDSTWLYSQQAQNSPTDDIDTVSAFYTGLRDTSTVSSPEDSLRLTIYEGDTSASYTVTTTDDGTLNGGAGFYEVIGFEMTDVNDSEYYQVSRSNYKGVVLIEDSSTYPTYSGEVEIWCQMHDYLEYEPIIDPDTSTTVTIEFGADGTDSTLRTKILDDIPVSNLWFRPSGTPTDVNEVEDLSDQLPYFRAIIQTGRRT